EVITCTYPFSLPIAGVAATFMSISALDGLRLHGVMKQEETKPITPWFNLDPKFEWIKPGLCDSFLPHIELTLAKVSAPGTVCAVTVEDDGLSQFIPYMYWKPERHSVVLRLYENQIVGPTQQPHAGGPAPDDPGPLAPWPEGSYFGNPYPLR